MKFLKIFLLFVVPLVVWGNTEAGLQLKFDAKSQMTTTVRDSVSGVEMGIHDVTTVNGVQYWDEDQFPMEQSAGPTIAIGQTYTHVYWVKWREDNSNQWRTLVRGSSDHCAIVEQGSTRLGMFSNRDGKFRSANYNIDKTKWRFLVVTGQGTSASSHGTSKFYVGGVGGETTVHVADADRVCSGVNWYRIGWGGQIPGKVGLVMQYNRILNLSEMESIREATKVDYAEVPEWGITDASWNFVNKDDMSYSQTFFTNQDIEQMKDANVLKAEYIQCDLEFYVQRDNTESLTTFKFMRLSDQKIFSVNMKGKMTNHQHWKTGSDCKTLICYDYEQSHPRYSGYCPKDFYDGTTPLEVPVLLLEVNFNPTSSYSDKWRNKWTLEGSEYYVRSKPRLSPKTYLYIANGKCGNNAQTGDTFDVASAKECRDSCDLNFHETYFSILTTEESPLSCTCYNDCDANSRRADANSEIYEVLSVHVSEILHDTELVNEKLEYDLAICTHSAQDVNNNLAVCQTEFTTCEESKQDVNINLAVCQSDLTTCEANKIALTDEKTLWKGRFEAVETLETEFNSNTFTNQAKVQLPGAEASIADTMSGVMQPHLISTVEKVGYVLFGVLLSSVFMWGTKKSKRDENLALLDCE